MIGPLQALGADAGRILDDVHGKTVLQAALGHAGAASAT